MDSSRPDSAAPAHRALQNAENSPVPLRGEVFDFDLDHPGELESQTASQKKAGAWFVATLAGLFCAYNIGAYVGQKSAAPIPLSSFAAPTEKLAPMRVQIAGRVKKPGVYTLPGGARLEDAIKQAGGALTGADLGALNLADWAVDGSKIEIPARQTLKITPTPTPIVIIKEVFVTPPQNAPSEQITEAAVPATSVSADSAPATREKPRSAEPKPRMRPKSSGKTAPEALFLLRKNPIDLNRASAEQLSALPGVGPKMAERIIAYRRENGGFKAISDLDNVKGIGEKRMETLQSLVKVK